MKPAILHRIAIFGLLLSCWSNLQTATCQTPDSPRNLRVIKGQTPACTFSLSPECITVPGNGISGFFDVTTSASSCQWTASTGIFWLHVIFGTSGTGNGRVNFSVDANTTPLPRSAAINAAGKLFRVTQQGGPDPTPPSVTLVTPTDGSTLSGTVTLTATATDNAGISQVEFYLDGTTLIGRALSSPFSVPCDTTAMANGTHTISAKAYDLAGNIAEDGSSVSLNNPTPVSGQCLAAISIGTTGQDYAQAVVRDQAGNLILGGSLFNVIYLRKLSPFMAPLWTISGGAGQITALATDSAEAIYVTGNFQGTINLGGEDLISKGGMDIFIAKYSSQGEHVWSTSYGSSNPSLQSFEGGLGIAADPDGKVFITGSFLNTVDFEGPDEPLVSAGQEDAFVAAFSASDGTNIWARRFGDSSKDSGLSLAVYQGSDSTLKGVVVSGYFIGNASWDGQTQLSSWAQDAFLVKFNPSGNVLWSESFAGLGEEYANGVTIDSAGDIFVTGVFDKDIKIGSDSFLASSYDSFVTKCSGVPSAKGLPLWSKSISGKGGQRTQGIAVTTTGNLVVAGHYTGETDFGNGLTNGVGQEIFAARFSSGDGTFLSFGHATSATGYGMSAEAGLNGQGYVAGYFHNSISCGGAVISSKGYADIVLLKFAR